MKPIRCAIVEDEAIARQILSRYLADLPDFVLEAVFENALVAQTYLQEHPIDLLFLDIEMPGLNGLSLLRSLPQPPKVIITTAYREYALEGYDLNAVDYLLKPISFERFQLALHKLFELQAFAPAQLPSATETPAFLYFKSGNKWVQVFLEEILYIEGLSNYVKIVGSKGTTVVYQKMSYLEEKLPAGLFLRIHKSYIVGLNKIAALYATDLEIGGKLLPVGEKYRPLLKALIGKKTI
ncbi:LytR/AlgR family response regulator transcription factor [Haliscomenobacter hydrossis]|uniref:Two component transcriptional regulator, LytTR family n=1 Tax=Haliscomenobacter hydrossis (strain ATCC 27775 / DSM 1100 / LMG 10767 / O) TaxID=760192 RepID=F4KUW2_HALH1|nr:LytTR family DNA-binding domain-containing protein [Haliscomenobacter hydrossis]AEE48138.1 two component transcriptional regulator, LytTR family [Haliscomenobacter hydrossis DSM 1100]